MGVVKNRKNKSEKTDKTKIENVKKNVANSKANSDGTVKKKKKVSCLQCIKKPHDDGGPEGKYRVAAPELMQDTFMSDSEDEGGEVECPIQQQQQYRYMNSEAGTLHRAKPLEDTVTDGHLWPSNNDKKVATIERQPLDIGFLVSFVVDARGGAMKAKRRGGVRVIVPPAACAAPTRVTCRAATRRAPAAAPPPLMEGEALASRLLELQPQGAKFLAPVVIEVPIFTSGCPEREIVVLRSDTGETWQDHYLHSNDNPMIQEALQKEREQFGSSGEALGENGERVTRIITCDFPHYLAVVSRIRQEVHIIGPEGGTVSSAHIPQVQALFPPQALTKRIRVGLQAHGAPPELRRRALPRRAAVSPVVTVEPRRRKFHRSITLTAPLPASQNGTHDKQSTQNLRLLCSIMGGQARAVWEDVTGSTPLTIAGDCASFTTTVSARFWLMNCQNVSEATKLATELYREMLVVPFEARVVVLAKRLDALEGRLLLLYITDRYAYDTLLQQEHYTEVAHSTAVRFLDGKDVYLEFSGNLVPVTKSGSQPMLKFEAFKDNRVEFPVRVKHHEESPSGRIYFMNEPKVPKGEQSQTPTCVLDVELPDRIAPRAGKSQIDYLNLDQSGFDALKDELSFHWGDHNNTGPASLPHPNDIQINGHDKITNGDVKYPTKETDDAITKPQANGDTLHIDTNKTKATFDSDEDKTPMNTLEKGKKKPEGGSFFGGIADKVKNVFGHSEDKEDDVKESSPKPQPKPRESKEKSPPKPAPRIINEDLLDKVEDMFKDLRTKPPQKDEDLANEVYTTKLIVEEDERPSGLHDIKEEIYEQYENMQPVDTPLRCAKSDPFQFYTGCCEGRFKKGEKHRHDETSNLLDRIENVNFTANEKLAEVSDKIQSDLKDSLEKVEKEKDNIKQKANEATEELFEKCEKVKDDFKNKEHELKSSFDDKVYDIEQTAHHKGHGLSESVHKLEDQSNEKAADIQSKLSAEIDNIKTSTENAFSHLSETADETKHNLKNKYHEFDFAARERAEELRAREHEKIVGFESAAESTIGNFKNKAQDLGTDIKTKTHDGAVALSDSVHSIQDDLNHKVQDIKSGVEKTAENVKETTNEKIHELDDSVEGAKEKVKEVTGEMKSKGKKKHKEGKNFFTGLVHNIFGEKEKIEDEIKDKVAQGKKKAGELKDEAAAKKNEIEDEVTKKHEELKDDAEQLVQNAKKKKDLTEKAVHNTKDEVIKAVRNKADETNKALQEKRDSIEKSINDKTEEAKNTLQNTRDSVEKTIHDKTEETKSTLQSTRDSAEKAIRDKTEDAKYTLQNTRDSVEKAFHDKTEEAKNTLENARDSVEKTVQDKTEEVKNTLQNTRDSVERSIHEKTAEVKNTLQDTRNSVERNIRDKTDETKQALQAKRDSVERAFYDTADEVKQTLQEKRDSTEKAIKEKKDEANNAFQNTKETLETTIHDTTNEMKRAVEDKRDSVEKAVHDKTDEAKRLLEDKKADVENTLHNKKESVEKVIHDKTEELGNVLHDKTDEAKKTLQNKKEEIGQAVHEKTELVKSTAQDELSRIRQEAEETTDAIKKSAENTLNAAAEKKAEFETNLANKVNDVKESGKETIEGVQKAASDKVNDLQRSSKQAFDHVQDATLSAFDKIESSAKDKVVDARDTWEDLQSTTRDTYADIRDDVYGLESSAQDTLHSFQSSAGDTFDSLDNSARDFAFGVQNTAQNAESNSKQLFGDMQDSFEGFVVSADNKLEDIKGATKDGLEQAGERLGEVKENVTGGVQEAEHTVVDTVSNEADKFTNSLNDLGNSVFGSSGKGFMKDSSTKLLESEKATSSPHKKSSGIPKLKKKNKK